jgi:hypothetical protein
VWQVMPVSIEEYRCAQVYMTARTSLTEATATDGAGVEILANQPTRHPKLGVSQYTKKIFHIDKRFPGWLRMIVPKAGSYLLEESWNAYPRTITDVTCPRFNSFRISVETEHLPDRGESNPHGLSKNCEIVHVDIAEQRTAGDEQESTQHGRQEPTVDLTSFRSKCGRGPLVGKWQTDVKPVMCAYKKVTCEFQTWGMQTRVENFMHQYEQALFHKANRNMFCWIDEWFGLTMHELRLFEAEVEQRINLIQRIKQGKDQGADLAALCTLRAIDFKGETHPRAHPHAASAKSSKTKTLPVNLSVQHAYAVGC